MQKLQRVGHVQKSIGSKGLGGKGKLMKRSIDRLQNYYGIAIRSNLNDLHGMQKAFRVSMIHVASSETNNVIVVIVDSWCKYQQDKAVGTNDTVSR